jgi:hypothetical protein
VWGNWIPHARKLGEFMLNMPIPATPRMAASPGRTVHLKSGAGTLIFSTDVDLFTLSDRDRDFVLSLVAMVDEYERTHTATDAPRTEESKT